MFCQLFLSLCNQFFQRDTFIFFVSEKITPHSFKWTWLLFVEPVDEIQKDRHINESYLAPLPWDTVYHALLCRVCKDILGCDHSNEHGARHNFSYVPFITLQKAVLNSNSLDLILPMVRPLKWKLLFNMQFRVILTCERGTFVTIPNENSFASLSCGTEIWINERLSGTSTWYYL